MGSDATPLARALTATAHRLAVRLWPDGGQGQARRNAWAAMVNDHITARAREEAERALRTALADGLAGSRPEARSAAP